MWGIESSHQTTGRTGSAAQMLIGETPTARNCGLCEHWLNDNITTVSSPHHTQRRQKTLERLVGKNDVNVPNNNPRIAQIPMLLTTLLDRDNLIPRPEAIAIRKCPGEARRG
jgi:hypothetical protein